MRGPAKLATYIAIGMILGGFALIALAWNGAAGIGYVQGQFPYLLSGGVAGLGLIGAGAGLLFVQVQRELDAEEARQYDHIVDTMRQTVVALRGGAPVRASVLAPARSESGTVRVVTAPAEAATAVAEETWAPPEPQDEPQDEALVVVGRSSFHDASCHLVSSRDDLELMPRDDAVDAGLRPCRVCKP